MTSKPDKRHTQIFLNMLKERGPHPHSRSDTEQADGNRTAARQNTTKQQARERESYPEDDAIDPETGMLRLRLVEAVDSGVRAHEYIMTKDGSPWRSYERIYQLRLGVGDRVTVAEHKSPPFNVITVRSLSGPRVEDKLRMLQQIQHTNFVSAFDAFKFEQSLHVVFEHMPISLQHIAGNPYINELRLALLTQITAYQECCHTPLTQSAKSDDIRALGIITMELMQGYANDDGAIGVDDLHRWPEGSSTIRFLSETTSASSVGELIEHPLIRLPWRKEKLKGLVSLASLWARRDYKYTPS